MKRSFCETNEILNNLLSFKKLQSNQIQPASEPVDICRTVTSCTTIFNKLAEDRNINLRVDLPESLYASCDETTIEAVLRNLIVNALKFTPAQGTVCISAYADMDNGIRHQS